jgi:cytochrome P450
MTSVPVKQITSQSSVGHVRPRRDFAAMEQRRLRAAELFEQGMIPAEVARQVSVSHQIVSDWLLLLGAPHRHPARFAAPDRLDLGRRDTAHLDFGRGIHFCIGAALARTELQIAITTVLRRMPELRLTRETVEWQTAPPIFRGLKALPVAF